MHPGESYRLNSHLVAIESEDGKTIRDRPAGATLRLAEAPFDESGLVHVIWEDTSLIMFRIDLEERATLLKNATPERTQPITSQRRRAQY